MVPSLFDGFFRHAWKRETIVKFVNTTTLDHWVKVSSHHECDTNRNKTGFKTPGICRLPRPLIPFPFLAHNIPCLMKNTTKTVHFVPPALLKFAVNEKLRNSLKQSRVFNLRCKRDELCISTGSVFSVVLSSTELFYLSALSQALSQV